MEADQLGRLRDILEASCLIASYVKDTVAFEGPCWFGQDFLRPRR